MAKQTFTTGQVLTAAQMTSLQQTAMGGGSPSTKTASYVLVAADAGTVIQMNNAGATTITVNTSLFAAGDSVQIQNIGAGTTTITAGTATVNTAGSLAVTQYDGGILYFSSASSAIWFDYTQTSSAATWAAFTPTWTNLTVGNGTTTARYVQNGKTVDFWVKFTLGSTSSVSTEPSMNFPVAAQSNEAGQCANLLYIYEDSGLSRYQGIVDPITNSSTTFRLCALNVSSTYATSTQITSSIPFSWGSGDSIYISGSYEAA
jgi:hypothetical protein